MQLERARCIADKAGNADRHVGRVAVNCQKHDQQSDHRTDTASFHVLSNSFMIFSFCEMREFYAVFSISCGVFNVKSILLII